MLLTEAAVAAYLFHVFIFIGGHVVRDGLFALALGLLYVWLGMVLQAPSKRWADFYAELMQLSEILLVVWVFGVLVARYFHMGMHSWVIGEAAFAIGAVNGALRFAVRLGLRIARRHGRNARYVVLVAYPEGEGQVRKLLVRHPELGLRLAGVVRPHDVLTLQATLRERVVDVLLIAASSLDPDVQEAADLGRMYGKDVKVLFQPSDQPVAVLDARDFYGASLLSLGNNPPSSIAIAGKRAIDLIVGVALLIVASPVLAMAAVAIKHEDPDAPIVYRQVRVGLNGRRFHLYKLRTMVPNAEQLQENVMHLNEMVGGPVFKIRNDPRVTKPGRWIRRLSIDELPQLWNVLRGEMSLVGPRPPLPHEVEQYPDRFRRRLSVRPGITGAWQVAGRNDIQFDAWMEMDLEYIDHWSLGRDLRILAQTIPTVISGRGAS